MARALVVGDILEVRAFCEAQNQVSINTLHYRVTALGIGGATDASLAPVLGAAVADAFKDYMGADADYRGIRLQVVHPLPKAPFVTDVTDAGGGAVAQDILPPQTAGLLTKLTALAGSRYRGLVYLPFAPETFSGADGRPNATGLVAMNAFGAALLIPLVMTVGADNVDLQPVVWSRKFSTYQNVIDYRPATDWGTHKSRSFNRRGDLSMP